MTSELARLRADAETKRIAALAAVERLANVEMNLSIGKWDEISNTILAALSPAPGDAEAVAVIPRYSHSTIMWSLDGHELKPSSDGYFVKYSDHIAVLASPSPAPEAEKMREALRAIRDCATPDIPDADFQRRARYDLQEIARAALKEEKAS